MTPTLGIMASQISGHLTPILGTTWVAGGNMPSSADWTGTAYGNSIFYAGINATGTAGASSPTGATWTSRSNPSTNLSATRFANGIFMGFGYPNIITTSSNGTSWSLATASGITNPVGATYGLSAFVASENGSTSAASSVNNGSTWTARTTSTIVQKLAGSSSRIVGIPNGTSSTATTNLTTWTTGTMPSSSNWYDVIAGNGIFVAVSVTSGTKAAYSSDGLSWTASTLPATGTWNCVLWAGANFAAFCNTGTTSATSLDGITWTSRTITNKWWFSGAVAPDRIVMVAYDASNVSTISTS